MLNLRPHEGWSETGVLVNGFELFEFLRPHEGWSETMGDAIRDNAPEPSDPTRVGLKPT